MGSPRPQQSWLAHWKDPDVQVGHGPNLYSFILPRPLTATCQVGQGPQSVLLYSPKSSHYHLPTFATRGLPFCG